MAKQAARRKPGTKPDAAWPEAANAPGRDEDEAAVRQTTPKREATLSSVSGARPRRRSARSSAIEPERNAAIAMGEMLTSDFRDAVEVAIRDAHADGMAVPARVDGVAVEIRPDGEVVPIDDRAPWSPVDWRKAATR